MSAESAKPDPNLGHVADTEATVNATTGETPGKAKSSNAATKDREEDQKLASRIGDIIAGSLDRIKPITDMMAKHLERAEADQRHDKLNEEELVKNVKPLIEQASQILNETHGAIKALDPTGKIAQSARSRSQAHEATPEEYYLAQKLTDLTDNVIKVIDKAKMTIEGMPRAKKDLSPLLVLLQNPLAQIIGAVGLLLSGVLGLVRQLLSGLGLGGLIDNLLGSIGLNKLVDSLGIGKLLGKK